MESGDWISTRPSLVLFSWAAENKDKNARLQCQGKCQLRVKQEQQ